MKRKSPRNTHRETKNNPWENKFKPAKQRIASAIKHMDEDDEDVEDLRENLAVEEDNVQPDTTTNWSEAQDRSEDLINETDPFVQDSEKPLRFPKDNRL